jgi:hypothetical protein
LQREKAREKREKKIHSSLIQTRRLTKKYPNCLRIETENARNGTARWRLQEGYDAKSIAVARPRVLNPVFPQGFPPRRELGALPMPSRRTTTLRKFRCQASSD